MSVKELMKIAEEQGVENCILSALEIAKLVLAEEVGQMYRETCLEHLDISDEEAEILQKKINKLLGENVA